MKRLFYFALGTLTGVAAVHFVKKYYPELTREEIERRLAELLAKIKENHAEGN